MARLAVPSLLILAATVPLHLAHSFSEAERRVIARPWQQQQQTRLLEETNSTKADHNEEEDHQDTHYTEEGHDDEHGHAHTEEEDSHGDDVHDDHSEDLLSSLKWSGIFSLEPQVYTLTVKIPEVGGDSHAGHNHRRNLWMTRTGERYLEEDAHFLMALVPVSTASQAGIDQAIEIVTESVTGAVSIYHNDTIIPSTENAYELFFNGMEDVAVLINITTSQDYVLFLPGWPSQVETTHTHFLVDAQQEDVWPQTARVIKEPEVNARDGPKPWGTVIGACLLVNLITLIGVIFLVPVLTTAVHTKTLPQALMDLMNHTTDITMIVNTRRRHMFDIAIASFACGALLATTVFLIVPEAIVLVNSSEGEEGGEDPHAGHNHRYLQEEDSHEGHDHGNKDWVFGTCLLAGFLLPMVMASFFPHHHDHTAVATNDVDDDLERTLAFATKEFDVGSRHKTYEISEEDTKSGSNNNNNVEEAVDDDSNDPTKDVKTVETADDGELKAPDLEVDARLVAAITLGDALHNFADGIFIGVAFLLCGSELGWSVLAATIYHELAQEVSDFFLLTQNAHLPPLKALAINFASGLSVTFGAIVVLAVDVSDFAIGIILSMSAGVYIYVAAKECMNNVDKLAHSAADRAWALFFFAIGAIPIGLVLLNHEHCEEG